MDNNQIFEIGLVTYSILLTGIVGWIAWHGRRGTETIENHRERIVKLESEALTHDAAHRLITNQISPLKEDFAELKSFMKEISETMLAIQIEMAKNNGYQQGKLEGRDKK